VLPLNIKDIEQRTGMSRANIRYYESLGLISPPRQDNGYRDYGEEDIAALLKIKLLRSLDVSLEDIGALSRGEADMDAVLSRCLTELKNKTQELQRSKELCSLMRSDNVSYESLDAAYYLERIPPRPAAVSQIREKDVPPKVTNFLLRYFARGLDLFIYGCIVSCPFLLGGVNISVLGTGSSILLIIMELLLMLVCEPLMLCTWGTTPGKWLAGLYIRDSRGKKLCYMEGLSRTFGVFFWGYGLFIPVFNIVRLIISAVVCSNEEDLRWEDGNVLIQKDEKRRRALYLLLGYALCAGLVLASAASAIMPDNRGDISIEQFVENYNDAVSFEGESSYRLTSSGIFEELPPSDGVYTINVLDSKMPEFVFYEDKGIMTGFDISLECSGDDIWPSSCASQISTAVQCFILGKTGKILSKDFEPLMDKLNEEPFEDFYITIRGYELRADYELTGYHQTGMGFCVPIDEASQRSYSLLFTLRSIE